MLEETQSRGAHNPSPEVLITQLENAQQNVCGQRLQLHSSLVCHWLTGEAARLSEVRT